MVTESKPVDRGGTERQIMCGLVGFWNRNGGDADATLVRQMLDKIVHRGPDDAGVWTGDGVGLGLCRLSILDLSERGHQPFLTRNGEGVLVYNGEVYNFPELRTELEACGHLFVSESDTEVVLAALQEWGVEAAVPRFNGMFAFAYYERATHSLWLVRDRAGIKPLYYARSGSLLAFASEAKALFAHPGIPCRPDMHTLITQVIHQRLAGTWTPFENVVSVMPGSMIKFSDETQTTVTYFDLLHDLDPMRIVRQEKTGIDQLAGEFEEIFRASVTDHLVSDAPLAMMCSGGLD